MRTISFPNGAIVPALGQGTGMMGEDSAMRADEIAGLREGVELGMTLIDTAEMCGEGGAERLVGEAVAGMRDRVFLVSEAYPQNASHARLRRSCEASLERLRTDRLDLYLLHWRGGVPLAETIEAMEQLVETGRILRWGVSNFDVDDMEELFEAGGSACSIDQILYSLGRRGPEHDLLPRLTERRVPAMAYNPVEQGRLLSNSTLRDVAERMKVARAQVALAWALRRRDVIVIPKASSIAHVRENRAAADLELTSEEIDAFDRAFPGPRSRVALEML